jgi:hypothetical protein
MAVLARGIDHADAETSEQLHYVILSDHSKTVLEP